MDFFNLEYLSTPSFYLSALALVVMLVILALLWYKTSGGKRSEKGHKAAIAGVLGRFGKIRGYKVLNDVPLQLGGQSFVADHILVGYFGLLLVSDLCGNGDYYGDLTDKNWVCTTKSKEDKPALRLGMVENPLTYNTKCIEALRDMLGKKNIYNLHIDSLVVAGYPKADMFITGHKDLIMNATQLRTLLGKSKYSADNGLDVEKIAAAIAAN